MTQVVQSETEGLEKGVGLWEGSRLVGKTQEGWQELRAGGD